MSKRITWLHLSDLHFRETEDFDERVVLAELLKDVAERQKREGLQADFVVFSGDLAFSGKEAEYARATTFLDKLLETVGLTKERLVLVPGNHDADRGAVTEAAKVVHQSLVDSTQVGLFRQTLRDTLQDAYRQEMLFKRLTGYRAFVTSYLGKHLPMSEPCGFAVKQLFLAGKKVAVLGLNSAWLSYGGEEDKGRLVLAEQQVRAGLEKTVGADLCIAVMHHPLEWLHDPDRYSVEPLLLQNCDFLLHGHVHETAAGNLTTPDAKAVVLSAGACYEAREYPNTYHWIQLDLAEGQGRVIMRRYSDDAAGFWTKDVMTYRSATEGTWAFALPSNLAGIASEEPVDAISRRVDSGQLRMRQAYVVFTTLAHLPGFLDAPEQLLPPFRLIATGDPRYIHRNGAKEQKEELRMQFGPPVQGVQPTAGHTSGCFVPGMGRIVEGSHTEWAPTAATAPSSHRGHVPWLLEPNWRVALDATALGLEICSSDYTIHTGVSLALHLYSYGLVAVCLRISLRCGQGMDWGDFVALLKAASPFLETHRQAKAYRARIGGQSVTVGAAGVAERAVSHLAAKLFQTPTKFIIQPSDEARAHTMIFVQEATRAPDPATDYPLMAGLVLLRPRWSDLSAEAAITVGKPVGDILQLEGDWLAASTERIALFAADAHRKARRKYIWRLHAWAELARAQAWMAQLSIPRLVELSADRASESDSPWSAFWRDLPGLGRRALSQRRHREVFKIFAESVGLELALEEFETQYARWRGVHDARH